MKKFFKVVLGLGALAAAGAAALTCYKKYIAKDNDDFDEFEDDLEEDDDDDNSSREYVSINVTADESEAEAEEAATEE